MSVSLEDVRKIATLAKLKFNAKEEVKLQHDLNKILEYVDELNELNLENVSPLENINDVKNVFREDIIESWLTTEEALKNATSKTQKFFKVPKVLEK